MGWGVSKGTFKLAHDFQKETVKYGADLKLDNDVKFNVSYTWPKKNAIKLEFEKDDFKAEYDHDKKDYTFKIKRSIPAGKLLLVQKVHNNKWEAVPSPKLELKTSVFSHSGFKDSATLAYDFSNQLATFEEAFKLDGKHKLKVYLDNTAGHDSSRVSLGTKVDHKFLTSLTAKYNKKTGPELVYKSKPLEGWKFKVHVKPNAKKADLALIWKPDVDYNAELVLDAAVPFDDAKSTSFAPRLSFKAHF